MLGSVGFTELLWIALFILLLLFGSKKLPELARAIGRAMGEFQKGKLEIEKELREASLQPASATNDRERLERAAKELGIQPEGKTDQQLKDEISKAVS
jgi:sec-independent protein translocase protein TatA